MTKTSEPKVIRYDAHCHVISREVFFDRIIILLLNATKRFDLNKLVLTESTIKTEQEKEDQIHILKLIKLLLENKTGAQTFNDLHEEYKEIDSNVQKFLPLMVDFEYIFRTKYYTSDETPADKDKQKKHKESLFDKLEKVRKEIEKSLRKDIQGIDKEKHALLSRFVNETKDINKVEDKKATGEDSVEIIKPYRRQLDTFKELKAQYKEDFQAFLATDPRRPGMMDLILENVGKDKPFTGIKLYPPMGYSPSDPFLMKKAPEGASDKELGVYQFAEKYNIPIIAHCSAAGFCTFVDRLEVIGSVMPDMNFDSQPVEYKQVTEIKFDTHIYDFSDAVQERAYKLNHPKLWEIVLKAFPNLKIDLAHFGGDPDKYGTERREYIYGLMTKRQNGQLSYPYLYTDLSCITDQNLIQKIYDEKFSQISDRVMYGSDYFLNLIWGIDFKTYYQNFTSVFGNSMNQISIENVDEFLSRYTPLVVANVGK